MIESRLNKSEKLVEAILDEAGMPRSAILLIKTLFQKQQEILITLEDVIRSKEYRRKYVDKRLDELLEKVDPEEAAKRKQRSGIESSAGPKVPSRGLI